VNIKCKHLNHLLIREQTKNKNDHLRPKFSVIHPQCRASRAKDRCKWARLIIVLFAFEWEVFWNNLKHQQKDKNKREEQILLPLYISMYRSNQNLSLKFCTFPNIPQKKYQSN
jgi:hypothetical protein